MSRQVSTLRHSPELVFVDDDALTLEIVSWNMRKHDCQPRLFSDPEKALRFLSDSVPQLLVVDYYMPTMTGIEFLYKARQLCDFQNTSVFICSSVTQELPLELVKAMNVSQLGKEVICNHTLLTGLLQKHLG